MPASQRLVNDRAHFVLSSEVLIAVVFSPLTSDELSEFDAWSASVYGRTVL